MQPSTSQNTLERSLAKAVTRLFSADLGVAAAGMLASIALARAVGVEALALYALAFGWLTVVEMLIDFGSDLHVARAVGSDAQQTGPIVRYVTHFKMHTAVLVLPLALSITFVLSTQFFTAVYLSAALLLAPARTHAQTSAAALRALQATKVLARIQGVLGVVQFLAAAAIIWWTSSLLWMLAAIAAADVLRAFLLRRAVGLRTPAARAAHITLEGASLAASLKIIRENAGLAMINLSSVLLVRAPLFLLEYFTGRLATGFYAAASRFINILRLLPGAIFNVLLPGFASGSASSSGLLLRRALLAALLIGIPISAGLALLAEWLVPWLLGAEFEPAVLVLQILAGRFTIHMLVHVFEARLLAGGHEALVNRVFAGELALLVLAAAFILPAYGAPGAAWVTLVTHALSCVALAFLAKLHFGPSQALPEPDRSA